MWAVAHGPLVLHVSDKEKHQTYLQEFSMCFWARRETGKGGNGVCKAGLGQGE
jgi:hypothetical protein